MPTKTVKIEDGDPDVTYRVVLGCSGHAVGDDGSVWTLWTRVGKGLGANGGRHSGKTCGWVWKQGDKWVRRKTATNSRGYLVVGIGRGADRKNYYVHDLVLTAFVGPRPAGYEACHDPDRTKTNCRLTNLRWGTKKDNRQDSVRHGTQVRGELTGTSVLTDETAGRAIRLLSEGNSVAEVARKLEVGETTIRRIRDNETWRHLPR